jgi:micrococcal nuclease
LNAIRNCIEVHVRGGALIAVVLVALAPGALRAETCRLQPASTHSVAKVIDGETLALDDGREVRLIGALAPKAIEVGAEAGSWPPEIAAREALAVLVLAKTVTLKFATEQTDRFGRLFAHVFVHEGEARRWVQAAMIAAGHARLYALKDQRACLADLGREEEMARTQGLGLWAHAAYAVRDARRVRDLNRLAGSFQIVDGTITSAAEGREAVYLNFGRTHSTDFTVEIRPGDRVLLGALGGDVKALEGRRVRVSGWIELRGGPMIDATSSGHVAFIDPPASSASTVSSTAPVEPPRRRRAERPKAVAE